MKKALIDGIPVRYKRTGKHADDIEYLPVREKRRKVKRGKEPKDRTRS